MNVSGQQRFVSYSIFPTVVVPGALCFLACFGGSHGIARTIWSSFTTILWQLCQTDVELVSFSIYFNCLNIDSWSTTLLLVLTSENELEIQVLSCTENYIIDEVDQLTEVLTIHTKQA